MQLKKQSWRTRSLPVHARATCEGGAYQRWETERDALKAQAAAIRATREWTDKEKVNLITAAEARGASPAVGSRERHSAQRNLPVRLARDRVGSSPICPFPTSDKFQTFSRYLRMPKNERRLPSR